MKLGQGALFACAVAAVAVVLSVVVPRLMDGTQHAPARESDTTHQQAEEGAVREDAAAAAAAAYADTPQTRGKINPASGDYETFAGVTCIAFVKDRLTNPGWARVYDAIAQDSVLSKYYTPLPVSSYHMTIHPMFTVADVRGATPRAFEAALARVQPGLAQFHTELVEHPFEPTGTVVGGGARGIIVLAVALDAQHAATTEKLRHRIAELTGMNEIRGYRQHITLAYRSTAPTRADEPLLKEAEARLMRLITTSVLPGGRVEFEPARVMLFHDMTLFQPTDPTAWSQHPLVQLPPTPPELKLKKKPDGWVPSWSTHKEQQQQEHEQQ